MALQVQVHVKLPRFSGVKVEPGRKLLDDIARAWLNYEPLPDGVKVNALWWRNGNKQWTKETRAGKIESARESFSKIRGWSATSAVG
jgi:hypothetical protein